MTITLFELIRDVASHVGALVEGVATGGSTTTIIDTVVRTEPDDYWNGGDALIIYDAGGAGAAPQGEIKRITDFVSSTSTITAGTFSVSVAASDRYAIMRRAYGENVRWSDVITQKINQALLALGPIETVDTTTITIATDQTEYELPLAAKQDLRKVWLQVDNTDANDNRWIEFNDWYIETKGAGSKSLLVLNRQLATGYKLKLVYLSDHTRLNAYTDKLNEIVPMQRVLYPATRDTFLWMKQVTGKTNWDEDIRRWEELAEAAAVRYRMNVLKKRAHFWKPEITDIIRLESEPNIVRL